MPCTIHVSKIFVGSSFNFFSFFRKVLEYLMQMQTSSGSIKDKACQSKYNNVTLYPLYSYKHFEMENINFKSSVSDLPVWNVSCYLVYPISNFK
jgi:hypothetical protein